MAQKKEPRLKSNHITKKLEKTDTGTGETEILTKEYSYKTPVEPNFVKMYLEDIATLYKCTRPEVDVLLEVLQIMDYKNVASLPTGAKQKIAVNLSLRSVNWVNLCIGQLVKKGIMAKESTGIYVVNPALFAKGTWKDIREIQYVATYNEEGRTIKTETKLI